MLLVLSAFLRLPQKLQGLKGFLKRKLVKESRFKVATSVCTLFHSLSHYVSVDYTHRESLKHAKGNGTSGITFVTQELVGTNE